MALRVKSFALTCVVGRLRIDGRKSLAITSVKMSERDATGSTESDTRRLCVKVATRLSINGVSICISGL
jgi:hypothetical protein